MDIGKTVKEGDRQPEPFKIPGVNAPARSPTPAPAPAPTTPAKTPEKVPA
jgi:hypothetical protein